MLERADLFLFKISKHVLTGLAQAVIDRLC